MHHALSWEPDYLRCPVWQSIFLKTLWVAQPFLSGLAKNGAVERPLTKFCSLHFLTRLLLSFLPTASCGTVSGSGPAGGWWCLLPGPPWIWKRKFPETSGLGPIQTNFHTCSGGANAFNFDLSPSARFARSTGRAEGSWQGPPVPDRAQSRPASGERLQWPRPGRGWAGRGLCFPGRLLCRRDRGAEGPSRHAISG